jgi:hypothetical protein
MTQQFTYGKSSAGNYAVAKGYNRTHGVWDAVEVKGDLYRVIDADEVPECDWDRIDALEKEGCSDDH